MNGMITVAKNSNNIDFIKYAYSLGIRDFRLNMDYEAESYSALSVLSQLRYDDIRIFGDFQGVKMRIQLEPSVINVQYQVGHTQMFYTNSDAYPYITNYDSIADYIRIGQTMNIADGKITGKIIEVNSNNIIIQFVEVNYVLRNNAGCSFIGDGIPTIRMTRNACSAIAKAKAVSEGLVNWVILSFVDSAEEIQDFVECMHKKGIKVMAKIETISGVENIESVNRVVDGFMIGRGDLRNTAKEQYNYYYKKALAQISKIDSKYSGVGTFFLSTYSDSLVLNNNELSDVFDIKEHSLDYIMLSKEVVNSKYPYETLRKLQELCFDIPLIEPQKNDEPIVVAIEGCNGAGKTTLLTKFSENYSDVECGLCVPNIYQTAKDMKHFMLFESSAMCSALYYLGGAVETKRLHDKRYKKILFDRSVWSTFAAAYAKDTSIIPTLFDCIKAITDYLFVPSKIIVLEASYETCKIRTNKKTEGGEFDKDVKEEMERKAQFYHLLKVAGYDVSFIQTDHMTKEDVYMRFCKIVEPIWSKVGREIQKV